MYQCVLSGFYGRGRGRVEFQLFTGGPLRAVVTANIPILLEACLYGQLAAPEPGITPMHLRPPPQSSYLLPTAHLD